MLKKLTGSQWFCLGMTVLMLILSVVVYLTDDLVETRTEVLLNKHKTGVGQLTANAPASQTFTASADAMCTLDVMVSTYNKKLTEGALTLWLTDDSGAEIARQQYPAEGMRNNAYVSLAVPVQGRSSGRTYTLYAASDCTQEKGLTLRMGPTEKPVGVLTMPDGAQTTEDALNIKVSYQEKKYSPIGGAIMLLMALCFASVIPMKGRKESRRA